MIDGGHNRRDALRRAALGAGAIAAAGMLRPGRAAAQTADEELRDFLAPAIGLEQVGALAYAIAAESNGISTDLKKTLELFRDQEQAHANALAAAIDTLGFDAPEPPESPADTGAFDDVDGIGDDMATELSDLLSGLEDVKGPEQWLDYLAKLEQEQLRYYLESGPVVDSEDLSATTAEIAGCQAQHLYVLRRQLGDNPLDAMVAAGDATDVGES